MKSNVPSPARARSRPPRSVSSSRSRSSSTSPIVPTHDSPHGERHVTTIREGFGAARDKSHGETLGDPPLQRRERHGDHRRVRTVSELNKEKIQLFVEAVLNEGHLDLIDELVATDYIGHIACAGRDVIGPDGVRWLVSCYRRSHQDLYVKVEDQIAEDDRVVTRWLAIRARTEC